VTRPVGNPLLRRSPRSRRSWLPLRSARARRWQPVLPVGLWAGLAMVIFGTPVVAITAYVGLVPGLGVLAFTVLLAAVIGHQWGRELRHFAHGISQAGNGDPLELNPVIHGVRELRTLDDAMSALHLRFQVADELAERYRRDAASAGTGMFELLSGLVAAEEGTRGQLAAELHDTVAQSLGAARRLLADDPGALDEVTPLVEEAEDALRATMARARPAALRDGDLAAAVSRFRDDLELRYGLHVALEWPVSAYPLPLATAVTIYRFFQEALINVVKHADVDEAVASLTVDARYVTAVVRDNGPGFDMSRQPVAGEGGRHVGLGLLRERARLAGGSVDVMSAPGAGTMLSLRLPRPAAPADWAAQLAPGTALDDSELSARDC
jgi:signal transduction histidine kinase